MTTPTTYEIVRQMMRGPLMSNDSPEERANTAILDALPEAEVKAAIHRLASELVERASCARAAFVAPPGDRAALPGLLYLEGEGGGIPRS